MLTTRENYAEAKAFALTPVAAEAGTMRGWPLPLVADALQKLCHDAMRISAGAEPRYFPAASLPRQADLVALVRWADELRRFARHAEHPWNADLGVESLVEQGREALQTPRSGQRGSKVESLHSRR